MSQWLITVFAAAIGFLGGFSVSMYCKVRAVEDEIEDIKEKVDRQNACCTNEAVDAQQ